jgi:hypothetical protein
MLVARQIADAAVDAMAPGDLAAVVHRFGVPQNSDIGSRPPAQDDRGKRLARRPVRCSRIRFGEYDPLTDGARLAACADGLISRIAKTSACPAPQMLLAWANRSSGGPRPMAADVGCEKRARFAREAIDALGTSA